MGDVNNDKMADAVVVTDGTWNVARSFGPYGTSITQTWKTSFGSSAAVSLLGDVNGDGRSDAVSIENGTWRVGIASSTANQFVVNALPNLTNFGAGASVKNMLADVNNDGRADAVSVALATGVWNVALSSGSTSFVATPSAWNTTLPSSAASNALLGDVNLDGRADAVVAENGAWKVALATTTSPFKFAAPTTFSSAMGTSNPMLADVDGDKQADAISYLGGVWTVARSTGTAFAPPTPWAKSFVPPAPGSQPLRLFAADIDYDPYTSGQPGEADAIAVTSGTWTTRTSPPVPDQIKASNSGWAPVLDDEFQTLDTTGVWNTQRYDYWLSTGHGLNGEWVGQPSSKPYSDKEGPTGPTGTSESLGSVYAPENNSVSGGVLTQTLTPSVASTNTSAGTPYKVGSLNTLPKIDPVTKNYVPNTGRKFRYGYVEAKVKVPGCAGCWPALFMLPAPSSLSSTAFLDNFWGTPEELDIFEFFPNLQSPWNHRQFFNAHWTPYYPSICVNAGAPCDFSTYSPPYSRQVVNDDLTGAWHTFGVLWTGWFMQFFVDGNVGERIFIGQPQREMYLISTLQHASGYPTTTTQKMETDYVKIYQSPY